MDNTLLALFAIGILVVVLIIYLARKHPADASSDQFYAGVVAQLETLRAQLSEKESELRELSAQLATRDQQVLHLQQTLQHQRADSESMHLRFKTEFENLANQLLDQKTERFTEQNTRNIALILNPLREKIGEFEAQIERKFVEETREKSGLKKEIEQLRDLNQQLSRDANNLASALKGQTKVQGNWGELQLEVLLEKSGLQKGVHFLTQATYTDDDGGAKRPDFIIQLPDNKQLIIDAKVSLTAFERYFNDPDPTARERHLKDHVDSLRRHVDGLSRKNYPSLYQINSPDYLLLFVPVESALSVATQTDPRLFTDALDRNIVLVSGGSLLATMRTVAHLWRQERQSRSVQEIARQSGLLYDKFVGFVEDLRTIGYRLDGAHSAWEDAMNKLTASARPGDTLVGRAEKIRELGARTSKSLPPDLVELAAENLPPDPETSD